MSALIKFSAAGYVPNPECSQLQPLKQPVTEQPSYSGTVMAVDAKLERVHKCFQEVKGQNQKLLQALNDLIAQSPEQEARRQLEIEQLKQKIKNAKETLQTLRQNKIQKLHETKQKILDAYTQRKDRMSSMKEKSDKQVSAVRLSLQDKETSSLRVIHESYQAKILEVIHIFEGFKMTCESEREQYLTKYRETTAPFDALIANCHNHKIIPEKREFYSIPELMTYLEERPKSIAKAKEHHKNILNQLILMTRNLRSSNEKGYNRQTLEKLITHMHSIKTGFNDNSPNLAS